jgi:hypothetical protein
MMPGSTLRLVRDEDSHDYGLDNAHYIGKRARMLSLSIAACPAFRNPSLISAWRAGWYAEDDFLKSIDVADARVDHLYPECSL